MFFHIFFDKLINSNQQIKETIVSKKNQNKLPKKRQISTIAIKAIDVIINEGLLENVKNVTPYFFKKLNEFNNYEHIGEIRGVGLMGALEIVKDKTTKTPFDSNLAIGEKVANTAIEYGLICRPIGASIVLCPQFIISKEQLDNLFDILHKSLKIVFKKIN